MERTCKNCGDLIYAGKSHCANCGAKWINNRITLRNVAADFSDIYLGLDNKFLKTFIEMFKAPDAVIDGYIDGLRNRYIDAIRYILLAIFFAGIYVLILRNVNPEFASFFDPNLYRSMGYSEEMIAQLKDMNQTMMNFLMDYQGIVILFSIPIYAIVARITFWSATRYYNFTEQIVFFFYVFGQASIVSSVVSAILLAIDPDLFIYWISIFIPLQFIYTAYCYYRTYKLTLKDVILKSLVAVAVIIATYVAIVILGIIVGILLKVIGVL